MPRLTIDGKQVEVAEGGTILDAARRLGIDVPTLCHLDGYRPSTSCLVCVVKVHGRARLVPACATVATDGMVVESEIPEVHTARRMSLELLLSDHLGDCVAPCQWACPVGMDIPLMLRRIREGDLRGAITTIKRDMALPAVLGRVCGKPCEKGCRRASADGTVAICRLKAHAAEHDLAQSEPYLPPCKPDSGKRVAVVGAGPCGLSAAFHLALAGHRVTLLEKQSELGGRLRHEFDQATLPEDLLDAEIAQIVRLGIDVQLDTCIDDIKKFGNLCADHDIVLVACGAEASKSAGLWGLETTERGIQVDRETYRTSMPAVFAAGIAVRGKGPVVRDVADGKQAAAAINATLTSLPLEPVRPFTVRAGRLASEDVAAMIDASNVLPEASTLPPGDADMSIEQAQREAARCLHCDCRGRGDCRLEHYARLYDARPDRYKAERRKLVIQRAASGLVYEPGKCIDCGLCIQVAERHRERLGLTFIGRGFDVRVGTPLDRTLDEALGEVAAECAAVCPTAALVMDKPVLKSVLPILRHS